MRKLIQLVEKAYNKKVDGSGLAAFRIAYSIVLFCEVFQLRYFRQLVFDPIPFIERSEIDLGIALDLWLVIIFFLGIGLFTRTSAVVNYILSIVFIAAIHTFEYHMFYAYMGVNFLLLFLPVSTVFSVDRVIKRVKYTRARYTHTPSTQVSVIYYYIPIFVGIALVYMDSVFFKIDSKTWMGGIGMWAPAVLPHFNRFGESFLLNTKFLALSLGYITLVFEAVFIFLFWFKPFRIPFLIIGLGLHIGILIFFPIPWFALGVSAIYLLLVPICFWKKLNSFFKSKRQNITFIYDGDCPLCNRTKVLLSCLDIFNKLNFITAQSAKSQYKELEQISDEELITDIHSIDSKNKIRKGVDTYAAVFIRMLYLAPIGVLIKTPGIYHIAKKLYGSIANNRERTPCTDESCVVFSPEVTDENKKIIGKITLANIRVGLLTLLFGGIVFLQLCVSYNSGIVGRKISASKFAQTSVGNFMSFFTDKVATRSQTFLGITKHAVFMDYHFKNYNHIIAIVYINNKKEIWLPIIDHNGQPDYYIYGSNWVKWTFRVNGATIGPKRLYGGIKRFTAFWAAKNNISLEDATFKLMVKKTETPKKWEENFLTKQMKNPWIEADTVRWIKGEFIFNEKNIEAL